ncbi:MAG: hypothetical protein LBT22_08235 [Peptococcaceae bacterium]|jgi:hypothetical protein|nr:hypothetical protein [Peptococcaceae bacterium]
MDTLFEKLKEYLKMDTEIAFEEFNDYYKQLILELNEKFNDFDQDACLKARFICTTVQSNAESRSKHSKAKGKAFKKIVSKCAFWADAIHFRLLKEGMTEAAIEEGIEAINREV